MKKFLYIGLLFLFGLSSYAQELYVFTNPASNIPAKAFVAKLSTKTMKSYHNNEREFRFSPELQIGINKKLMLAT